MPYSIALTNLKRCNFIILIFIYLNKLLQPNDFLLGTGLLGYASVCVRDLGVYMILVSAICFKAL